MKVTYRFFIILFLIQLIPFSLFAESLLGTLTFIQGNVELKTKTSSFLITDSSVLHDGDEVIVSDHSYATVFLRDNSEIRLLSNTKIQFTNSFETPNDKNRMFLNRIQVIKGRLWARLVNQNQNTVFFINKSTVKSDQSLINLEVKKDSFSVSVSSGKILVANKVENITLPSGNMLLKVMDLSKLKQIIEPMPYQLTLKTIVPIIEIPELSQTFEVPIVLQVNNFVTGDNVYLSEKVYFSSILDKFTFPDNLILNKRGYARAFIKILPFQKSDYYLGQVSIFAVLEGPSFIKTGTTSLLLRYVIPDSTRGRVWFNVDTGEIK